MQTSSTLSRYQILNEIGKGSYGLVYKAKDLQTNSIIALKKLQLHDSQGGLTNSILREVSLLRQLFHPNIVSIKDFFIEEQSDYISFEYLSTDLRSFMNSVSSRLPETAIKFYTHQILSGLSFCHSNFIVHRDLKPQNILLTNEEVKIADFGLSKVNGESGDVSTPVVQTLWYRAPEVILGGKESGKIDVWSVGCIFAEMVSGKPLFTGSSSLDQIRKIFEVLGTPDESDWPGVSGFQVYCELPRVSRRNFKDIFPTLSSDGIDFVSRMLALNPEKRMTAQEAKSHIYLREFNYGGCYQS